ncbi:tol [Fusarium albosuccineum]|uniref:Tol n=1 Tax=Fusarium albosuccineum TaxID=1237068 RepID=A0A8H4LE78_9HYPO|nr:tol [Fusarium albosuccineum]
MDPASTYDYVCEPCRGLDFTKTLDALKSDSLPEWGGVLLDENMARFAPPLETNCSFCKLISGIVQQNCKSLPNTKRLELRAFSFLPEGARHVTPGAKDCLTIFPKLINWDFPDQRAVGKLGHAVCFLRESKARLLKPQVIPQSFDHTRARLWINNCKEDHGNRCNRPSTDSSGVPGMKLIDCQTFEVIPASAFMQWIALSYVWGPEKKTYAPQASQKLPSELSTTVRDAIEVTKLLGYQYLWIDKFCIDQSDAAERTDQIQKMGLIYSKAEVVIVAAAGADEHYGLPGVGSTKRLKQVLFNIDDVTIMSTGPSPAIYVEKRSRWWKRGWTFQEGVLATRLLVFTEHQAFFECNGATWMEGLGGLELILNRQTINWSSQWKLGTSFMSDYRGLPERPWNENNKQPVATHLRIASRMQDFFRTVQQYTTRDLSFETDSLNAAIGIMRFLSKKEPRILNFVGLPYYAPADSDEFIEPCLFASLSWYHRFDSAPRRRADFPSWTWAGWAGAIRWMCSVPLMSLKDLHPKLRQVLFETDDGSTATALDFLRPRQLPVPPPVAIRFEARLIPASLFSVEGGLENWNRVTVDGNNVSMQGERPPTETPAELLQRLENGTCGCLLLGDFVGSVTGLPQIRYLLVVEWHGRQTATRFGALVVQTEDKHDGIFHADDLPWTRALWRYDQKGDPAPINLIQENKPLLNQWFLSSIFSDAEFYSVFAPESRAWHESHVR